MTETTKQPLFTDSEWTTELIEKVYLEIERIAVDHFKLNVFPNQIEIISSEQMLDAYSSVGMPVMYPHWSFGKQFSAERQRYKRGMMGLAYEIVINSNPCIAYCMEDNSMLMQTLVIAHASFGHNSFFKNNYLFKQWTSADNIIDYLVFGRNYITDCEEKYGAKRVEQLLDACHSLKYHGVDKYKRPPQMSAKEESKKKEERAAALQADINELWKTIPTNEKESLVDDTDEPSFPSEPQENILYFVEKHAPNLEPWEREIIRIVRIISQYFYPQMQTGVMNEGWATFTHYNILHQMRAEGLLTEGAMLEFMQSHTNVINQLPYNHGAFSGINVYALGFAMFQDIKRVCMEPTEEDINWFPDWAGNGDWIKTCTHAMENFKDESFIQQFLSPKVIRDLKLFAIEDDDRETMIEVIDIHDDEGYRNIRECLADNYRLSSTMPSIEVVHVDLHGDRSIKLNHTMHDRKELHHDDVIRTIKNLASMWKFDVHLDSIAADGSVHTSYHYDREHDEIQLDTFI